MNAGKPQLRAAIIGCGYVGTAVAQHWKAKGFDILATTTRPERVAPLLTVANQVEVLRGTEAERLQAALADRQVVLLCVGPKRDGSYAETYLNTAQTLAQVLPKTAIRQVIYTSTSSVYGQRLSSQPLELQSITSPLLDFPSDLPSDLWITEAMPPAPVHENSKIIAATEQALLEMATPQRQVCVLRLGGIYGPGRTVEEIYRRAAGTARSGNGSQSSHWVHLSDVVGAIDWAYQRQLSGIYNLVQDEIPTARELIGRVCDRLNLAPVQWEDSADPSSEASRCRIANNKLKSTGYEFVHPTFWPSA
jgi:nucleoside-diphosphate-sugar epimerase